MLRQPTTEATERDAVVEGLTGELDACSEQLVNTHNATLKRTGERDESRRELKQCRGQLVPTQVELEQEKARTWMWRPFWVGFGTGAAAVLGTGLLLVLL